MVAHYQQCILALLHVMVAGHWQVRTLQKFVSSEVSLEDAKTLLEPLLRDKTAVSWRGTWSSEGNLRSLLPFTRKISLKYEPRPTLGSFACPCNSLKAVDIATFKLYVVAICRLKP